MRTPKFSSYIVSLFLLSYVPCSVLLILKPIQVFLCPPLHKKLAPASG